MLMSKGAARLPVRGPHEGSAWSTLDSGLSSLLFGLSLGLQCLGTVRSAFQSTSQCVVMSACSCGAGGKGSASTGCDRFN